MAEKDVIMPLAKPDSIIQLQKPETPIDLQNIGCPTATSVNFQTLYKPPINDFFKVRIVHIDKEAGIYYVMGYEYANLKRLEDNQTYYYYYKPIPCLAQEIVADANVIVPCDGILRCAKIRHVIIGEPSYALCTLDSGYKIRATFDQIYSDTNFSADYTFTFGIKLSKKDLRKGIGITIKLEEKKFSENIYVAELLTREHILRLPLNILKAAPEFELIKLLTPQTAIVRVNAFTLNDELNTHCQAYQLDEHGSQFPWNYDHEIGYLLAARTEKGWRRAIVVARLGSSPYFVVFLVDDGRLIVSNILKRMPLKYIGVPSSIFILDVFKNNLNCHIMKSARRMTIKAVIDPKAPASNTDESASIKCTICIDKKLFKDCFIKQFSGTLEETGLKYWKTELFDGNKVFITRLINYNEFFISSINTKVYKDVFAKLLDVCKPYKQEEFVPINDIVVVTENNNIYRAEVLSYNKNVQIYKVIDIDSGTISCIPIGSMRHPTKLIVSCPSYLRKISLDQLENIQVSAYNEAQQAMEYFAANQQEFIVEFKKDNEKRLGMTKCAKLYFPDMNPLADYLLPLIFKKMDKETQVVEQQLMMNEGPATFPIQNHF